jgi:uncharacterized Fe-S cluster protein YjdI
LFSKGTKMKLCIHCGFCVRAKKALFIGIIFRLSYNTK